MNKTFDGRTPNENSLLDLDRSDTHIHNIDAKRCKVNNDSATYLWHCRLGHIGVKRMKKLHKDGFLESLDYESFDACEPCLMGKMTKIAFSGTMERATDLFGIIHSDVCGPMSIEAKKCKVNSMISNKSVARSIVPENRILVILPIRHGSQAPSDS